MHTRTTTNSIVIGVITIALFSAHCSD